MNSISFIFSLGISDWNPWTLLLSLDVSSLSLVKEAGVISTSIILAIKTPHQRIMDINWSIYPNSHITNQIQLKVKHELLPDFLHPLLLPFLRKLQQESRQPIYFCFPFRPFTVNKHLAFSKLIAAQFSALFREPWKKELSNRPNMSLTRQPYDLALCFSHTDEEGNCDYSSWKGCGGVWDKIANVSLACQV